MLNIKKLEIKITPSDHKAAKISYSRFLENDTLHFDDLYDNLPSNLKYLTFGEEFNKTVDYLPDGLVVLKFGTYTIGSIDNLPDSIQELSFGAKFKRKI